MSNKPITRKEMFMAKASGQNVNTPKPITREEKFLEKIAKNGGKATSWKDLGETTVMGDTLTWDGNTEGLYSPDGWLYHVSDVVPTIEELRQGCVVYDDVGDVKFVDSETVVALSENVYGCVINGAPFMVASVDHSAIQKDNNTLVFEKAGVYFQRVILSNGIAFTAKLTINGYNGFERTEITTLPNKYLDIVETVEGDTLTWDGNITGQVTTIDNWGYEFAKVSDIVPEITDFMGGYSYHYSDSSYDYAYPEGLDYTEDVINCDYMIYIALKDDVSYELANDDGSSWMMHFPERGIYFCNGIDVDPNYSVCKFTINGYKGFAKSTVKNEHLPDSVMFSKKVSPVLVCDVKLAPEIFINSLPWNAGEISTFEHITPDKWNRFVSIMMDAKIIKTYDCDTISSIRSLRDTDWIPEGFVDGVEFGMAYMVIPSNAWIDITSNDFRCLYDEINQKVEIKNVKHQNVAFDLLANEIFMNCNQAE